MAKYDALRDHLTARSGDTVNMTIAEVEQVVGNLPPTAWNTRAWWANDSKVQAKAWRAAGWHVDSVMLSSQRVVFARGEVGGTLAARIAAGEHTVTSRAAVQRAADDEKFCPTCYVAVPQSGICDSCAD
ncbi:MAG: hypothetical protein AVDCRST_MAG47-682 [uncultured Nocardioidaceae bacterium]|uniref:DUF7662 domain-containing protein n=1 Tax=uncultured Nocardioidaceae bacterium TaxID=253824 RepID=A0A6J4MRQ1_9ACTN|nr:MAG: hypothetical protein AVDCRST_MAG47-682 [uncultured Nocardioidaceae bacterium]